MSSSEAAHPLQVVGQHLEADDAAPVVGDQVGGLEPDGVQEAHHVAGQQAPADAHRLSVRPKPRLSGAKQA
ncbi:MAG: hypothetical protein R2755_15770 [Acidimicrobiales bacterium]